MIFFYFLLLRIVYNTFFGIVQTRVTLGVIDILPPINRGNSYGGKLKVMVSGDRRKKKSANKHPNQTFSKSQVTDRFCLVALSRAQIKWRHFLLPLPN